MAIQVELWQLLTFMAGLLISFFGAAFAAGKLFGGQMLSGLNERFATQEKARLEGSALLRNSLDQVQTGLDERFETQDKARLEGSALLRNTLDQHLEEERLSRAQLQSLEREFLLWRSDLPLKHSERISRLEAAIVAAPTHEDLAVIHTKINGVADGVSRLRGEFSGASNVLNMIHEHLLRGNTP